MNSLSEQDKSVKDNIYLQIAWKVLKSLNAATVGLNPTRIKKKLLKRNTILFYDIPKFCKLLDNQQESMLLKTKARLLFGVSNIMRQKSFFLYEDSLLLYNKLQSGMAVPAKTDHIDLERPITSKLAITLKDNDDLLEYQSSSDAPFSSLFNFNRAKRANESADNNNDEDLCSILKMTNSLSIDLSHNESEYLEMLIPSFTDNYLGNGDTAHPIDGGLPNTTDQKIPPQQDLFDNMMDYGDDMYFNDNNDGNETNLAATPTGVADPPSNSTSALMDDSVFAFPNDLDPADIINSRRLSAHSASSTATAPPKTANSAGSLNAGGGHMRNPNGPPSLIREEDEDDASLSSIATDMYPGIVFDENDEDEIMVSPIPPERPRPRIVQRMTMEHEGDTMLLWSSYNSENIMRRSSDENQPAPSFAGRGGGVNHNKMKMIKKELRFPSITFNPFQRNNEDLLGEELAIFVMGDNRNRLFFPYSDPNQLHTEYARRNYTERARRAEHRLHNALSSSHHSSSGSVGGGRPHVSLRSSSDVTTPDMHNLDLGDLDLQDARNGQHLPTRPPSLAGFDDFQQQDDNIDYDYLDFDNGFQDLLDNNQPYMMGDQQQTQDNDEQGLRDFLEELHLFLLPNTNNQVHIDDLFQLKNRSEVAKSFYYILELSSKSKIKPIQVEAFGSIDAQLLL